MAITLRVYFTQFCPILNFTLFTLQWCLKKFWINILLDIFHATFKHFIGFGVSLSKTCTSFVWLGANTFCFVFFGDSKYIVSFLRYLMTLSAAILGKLNKCYSFINLKQTMMTRLHWENINKKHGFISMKTMEARFLKFNLY